MLINENVLIVSHKNSLNFYDLCDLTNVSCIRKSCYPQCEILGMSSIDDKKCIIVLFGRSFDQHGNAKH